MSSGNYRLLEGKKLAGAVIEEIASDVAAIAAEGKRQPGLAVILVGQDPASQTYVKNKAKAASRCGFRTFDYRLQASIDIQELLAQVQECNNNQAIDGILVQLPLPGELARHTDRVISCIDPSKDADGLHPYNQGLLIAGKAATLPCTPSGCMRLLDLAFSTGFSYQATPPQADLSGKTAVVVGRSILVGKPLALMLLQRNATVTVAHSRSPEIEQICRGADILVAAVGVPQLVKASWVKDGSTVIDVGINRLHDAQGKPYLVGDVDFEQVAPKAFAITPVPGGVGPLTVATLMSNTWNAYKRHRG